MRTVRNFVASWGQMLIVRVISAGSCIVLRLSYPSLTRLRMRLLIRKVRHVLVLADLTLDVFLFVFMLTLVSVR
jgi:hypothetical protein